MWNCDLNACQIFFELTSKAASRTSSRTVSRIFTCSVSVSVLLLSGANSLHPEGRGEVKEDEKTDERYFNSVLEPVPNICSELLSLYILNIYLVHFCRC